MSDTDGPRREAHRDLLGPVPEPVSERKQIDRQVLTAVVKGTTDIVFSDITGDRNRGYDPFALANAYACRVAHPDINSDLQHHLFLKRHADELPKLGFDPEKDPPSRGALERFRERVKDEALYRIEHGYMGVQQEILVNFDRNDPDEYVTTYAQSDEVSEQQLRQAYEKIKPELDAAIPDGRDGDKTSFEWERFRDILAESMLQRESASQILRNRRRPQKPEDVEPVPVQHCDPDEREMRIRTFFDGFEKHSATKYMKGFEGVFEQLIRRAKRNGLYDRPVDVHIDGTDFIYTPQSRDENGQKKIAEGAVGTKGGEYAYKFLTVSIEDRQSGRSMKPVVFPMRDRSLLFRAVAYVVRRVDEFMNIREVKADSEFATADILNFLQNQGIDYRMRYSKSGKEIEQWLKGMSGSVTAGARDYTINGANASHDTRLVAKRAKYGKTDLDLPEHQTQFDDYVVDDEEGQLELDDFDGEDPEEYDGPWFVYVTSHDVPDDPSSARKAAKQYAKRWQIETDYRVVKHNFMARTNSTEYEIRVLWWLYAVALFSAWKLADLAVRDGRDFEDEPYAVRSRDFADAIKRTAHG